MIRIHAVHMYRVYLPTYPPIHPPVYPSLRPPTSISISENVSPGPSPTSPNGGFARCLTCADTTIPPKLGAVQIPPTGNVYFDASSQARVNIVPLQRADADSRILGGFPHRIAGHVTIQPTFSLRGSTRQSSISRESIIDLWIIKSE